MARADILVILSNDTRGRIPAKLYDYVQTKRPILSIASNDELRSLVERHGGQMFHFDQIDAMAEVVVSQLDSGTADVARPYANELSSRRAAKELAGILDEITETKTNR